MADPLTQPNMTTAPPRNTISLSKLYKKRAKDWSVGLLMLGCVVILWVLSSFLIGDVFEDGSYSKPFLITYLNTASFSFYLIPHLSKIIYGDIKRRLSSNSRDPTTSTTTTLESANANVSTISEEEHNSLISNIQSYNAIENENTNNRTSILESIKSNSSHVELLPPLTIRETAELSAWFCSLWFLSNLFNNASLLYTSVSSQTILSSTSSFFTMIIGFLFGIENFNYLKLFGIALSFTGVCLVTNNDLVSGLISNTTTTITDNDGNKNLLIFIGNLLALGGALGYGIYSVLLKLKVKNDERMDMRIFFGFVGVFNTLFLWPPILILHYIGIEKLEMPPNYRILNILLLNCSISFLADYLWAKAMILTSPLTVTVGLSLTIPVAMIGDFIIKHIVNSFVYTIGAIVICLSFIIINHSEKTDEDENVLHTIESVIV
ncbi:hypothetical protein BVG19_g3591 [[Candida] boidinii]|nr:hypothetical protein BVG19_g3591 [[Candida] boidinii]OWB49610.1 hypothetical protein B5S27_g1151 [[Candida] boidinii]